MKATQKLWVPSLGQEDPLHFKTITRVDKDVERVFPGGPVAETPHLPCRGPGFDPFSGN